MLYSYVSFLFLAHKGDIDVARRRVDSTWTLSIEEQRGSFLSTVTFTRFVLYSSLCLSLSLGYTIVLALSLCAVLCHVELPFHFWSYREPLSCESAADTLSLLHFTSQPQVLLSTLFIQL